MKFLAALLVAMTLGGACQNHKQKAASSGSASVSRADLCDDLKDEDNLLYQEARILFVPFSVDSTVRQWVGICHSYHQPVKVVRFEDAQGLHNPVICPPGTEPRFRYVGAKPASTTLMNLQSSHLKVETVALAIIDPDYLLAVYDCETVTY